MKKLRQFELVIEIARQGSISKAARCLNLAQPTLSKYLSNLEQELGLELFDRTTLPIKLTEAGNRYLLSGRRILDTYKKLEKDLDMIKADMFEAVRIGISPTRAHFILPQLIKKFKNVSPDTKIVVVEKTVKELNNDLKMGRLDLVISMRNDDTSQFDSTELFTEDIMIAVPSEFSAYDAERILNECPFISTGNGLYLSNVLYDILYEYEREEPLIEVQSIESALALVNRGLRVSLVPSYIKKYSNYDNVKFIDLPDDLRKRKHLSLSRQICVFHRHGQILNKAEKEFIKIAKEL